MNMKTQLCRLTRKTKPTKALVIFTIFKADVRGGIHELSSYWYPSAETYEGPVV